MGKFGPLVGAIDSGTSSGRFMIFKAETTECVCYHQKNLTQIFPQDGYHEHDPMEIMAVTLECIDGAVKKLIELGGAAEDIVAIGITNQRETTILWDKNTGEPLHNAIVWCDNRTSTTVNQLLEKVPNKTKNQNYLKPLCGLPFSTYFSAVKLRWLLDNVPRVQNALKNGDDILFGTVDTWLIWNLTGGVHVTDVTNASRTMLMNLETLQWDPILIQYFDIPESIILPEIKTSSEVYGHVKKGSLQGVPISGCLGDQQAALVGQQCLKSGQAKCTYGTGCFLLYNTGPAKIDSFHGMLTTVAYQWKDSIPIYALEGSVSVAGSCLSWLKDNIGIFKTYDEMDELIASVEDCGDIYFVPAFAGLYAPYWNSEARGTLCGLNEDTQQGHIIRASMESVCFQVRDILDSMKSDSGITLPRLLVDGGMTTNNALMQWQADLTGLEVKRPSFLETTALGAAMAAGRAVGKWNMDVNLEMVSSKYKPSISEDEKDQRYNKWKMAIERSLGWDD